MTERNKDGPFHSAAPCELQFQKAKKKKKKRHKIFSYLSNYDSTYKYM